MTTKYYYCNRIVQYVDNEDVCIANIRYENYATGDYFTDVEIDVDEVDEGYARRVVESENNIIVNGETYHEDVELILYDLVNNHKATCISLYVNGYIDLKLPTIMYRISDIMLLIDIISYNTPDDVQIIASFDNGIMDFEFYC